MLAGKCSAFAVAQTRLLAQRGAVCAALDRCCQVRQQLTAHAKVLTACLYTSLPRPPCFSRHALTERFPQLEFSLAWVRHIACSLRPPVSTHLLSRRRPAPLQPSKPTIRQCHCLALSTGQKSTGRRRRRSQTLLPLSRRAASSLQPGFCTYCLLHVTVF